MIPKKQILLVELLALLFAILLAAAVLYPIITKVSDYPFLVVNVAYVIVLLTFTRYIFLLKFTLFARTEWIKFLLVFLCIPIGWILIEQLHGFQIFLDNLSENQTLNFKQNTSLLSQDNTINYMRTEMIFFATSSIIATIILPVRLIISIWNMRNRGKV